MGFLVCLYRTNYIIIFLLLHYTFLDDKRGQALYMLYLHNVYTRGVRDFVRME